jgi:hypothetical protein
MAIRTTRWSPDTCDTPPCIIEYTWDDTVNQNQRTHTVSKVLNKCTAHSAIADSTQHYNVLTEENPRKNNGLQLVIDNAPLAFVNVDPVSGVKTLKDGLNLSFTVAGTQPNRVFTLIFTGTTLTQAQKDGVQSRLDTRFGAGKVIFVNG